jgi:hypothetical protein
MGYETHTGREKFIQNLFRISQGNMICGRPRYEWQNIKMDLTNYIKQPIKLLQRTGNYIKILTPILTERKSKVRK